MILKGGLEFGILARYQLKRFIYLEPFSSAGYQKSILETL